VAYRDKTIATVVGPVELRRAWYHCSHCGHGLAPRDEQLEVVGTSLTPGLRRMIDRAGAAAPFTPAAGLLSDLAGVAVNAKAVQRAAETDGQAAAAAITARAEAIRTRVLVPLPPCPLPDILYVAIDGTGVPMTAGETAGRAGKTARPDGQGGTLPDDGRARTREVKLAQSRPGARCRDYSRSVSPSLSPNPPCASQRNGLSTVPTVMRVERPRGWGSYCRGSGTE
jgi:hypothetical protein